MNPGDYLIMVKPVTEKYAIEYCQSAGLHVGGICFYVEDKDNYSAIVRVGNIHTEVGRGFIKDHFKKSSRMENLEKLLN